jgi:ATP-dependent Lon protease
VNKFLGPPQYSEWLVNEVDDIGVANGLAWTEAGGDVMQVEVAIVGGKGSLTLTGQLGEVMQESARAALSYVRSRGDMLGLPRYFFEKIDLHVHVPEGAIPKDGPSAGVTMATSFVSALTGIPVDKNVAMTGEVTLRGNVLPIGGLKEKALAAHRGGIRKVIFPKENENDIEDIPATVRAELELIPASHIDEVLMDALIGLDSKEFEKVLDRKASRDEILFGEPDSEEKEHRENKKDSSGGVIAH